MTWFFVDDNLDGHRKADDTSNAALGLWVRCGALCARNGTDGLITAAQAKRRGTAGQIAELVRVGWWEPVEDGYQMHDWEQWQTTAAQRAERKAARSAAGAKGGKASGQTRRGKPQRSEREASASPVVHPPPNDSGTETNPAPSPYGLTHPTPSGSNEPGGPSAALEVVPDTMRQADEITKAWWRTFEPPPTQKFIAVKKIAEQLIKAGWTPEAVLREMQACGSTIVRARVEDRLRGQGSSRQSTTDRRVADNLAVVARFAEQERGAS